MRAPRPETGFFSVPPSCNLCNSNTRVQEQQLIPASPSLCGNAGCSINDAQQTAHVITALLDSDLRPRTLARLYVLTNAANTAKAANAVNSANAANDANC